MSRIFILLFILALVAPGLADWDVLPVHGMQGVLHYDAASGTLTPVECESRSTLGRSFWAATEPSGSFLAITSDRCWLDWADMADDATLGGLGFAYATNSQQDQTIIVMLYANDNGWGDTHKNRLLALEIENLPGSIYPPNEYWGYAIDVSLDEPIHIDADDLDGDGLDDFSYLYWTNQFPPGGRLGPILAMADDPNQTPPPAPGIDGVFDLYANPDFVNDPNLATSYMGTYWFGDPPTQLYLELFAPGCPFPGLSGKYCSGDIGNFNCVVDISDLAQLLGHYGEANASYFDGDIFPDDALASGDGVVNLNDLAALLGQYGDDCGGY